MMTEIAQLLGTGFIVGLGLLGLYTVAEHQRWCSYGRETLFWFAVSQFWFATWRTLGIFHLINGETQRAGTGLGAAITFAIILNLVILHVLWHRNGLADHGRVRT